MHYFRQGHQQRPIGRKAGLVLLILERVGQHACSQTEQTAI